MKAPIVITGIVCVLAVSGCGGGNTAGHTTSSTSHSPTRTGSASPGRLKAAVRSSLNAYHRLSVRSLWSNTIDSHPVAIAGPALSDLRTALAQRRTRRVRVRLLSDRFHITSIHLDPSFATATALVADPQRVQPYGYDGQPLGRAVNLNEHARIELHRADRPLRFVVWKVSATK
jgi:hypothetical protein